MAFPKLKLQRIRDYPWVVLDGIHKLTKVMKIFCPAASFVRHSRSKVIYSKNVKPKKIWMVLNAFKETKVFVLLQLSFHVCYLQLLLKAIISNIERQKLFTMYESYIIVVVMFICLYNKLPLSIYPTDDYRNFSRSSNCDINLFNSTNWYRKVFFVKLLLKY